MRPAALLAVLALAACGYHLAGTGAVVPEGARTIRIELFTNRTHETGLEVRLHRAVEDQFRRQGTLRVATDGDADLVLSGTIRSFTSVPVAFSATDEAVQYQGIMRVGLRLSESASGHVLFANKLLQQSQDFGAVSGVVISSSPHFQRGTINARDLPDLTNVQIGEARRREAQGDLIELLARDIYLQTMEGF